jgi:hypothetical protein
VRGAIRAAGRGMGSQRALCMAMCSADVCARHGSWLHVDAIWGGALAYSRKPEYLPLSVSPAAAPSITRAPAHHPCVA